VSTAQRADAAVNTIQALAEVVRIAGEIPSGHLYARFRGALTLNGYQAAIELLKGANLVEEHNFLLRWIGPERPDARLGAYRGRPADGPDLIIDPELALKALDAGE
jgi:hypothetical protein